MPFVWPTPARIVTSRLGDPRPYGGHEGVDIAPSAAELRRGLPSVHAIAPGRVVKIGYMPQGYGNYVVVQHPDGMQSLYAHLSKITVQQGQRLGGGDMLGYMGKTGMATGVHLHLTVRDKEGRVINPLTLDWSGRAMTVRKPAKPTFTVKDFTFRTGRRRGDDIRGRLMNFLRGLGMKEADAMVASQRDDYQRAFQDLLKAYPNPDPSDPAIANYFWGRVDSYNEGGTVLGLPNAKEIVNEGIDAIEDWVTDHSLTLVVVLIALGMIYGGFRGIANAGS